MKLHIKSNLMPLFIDLEGQNVHLWQFVLKIVDDFGSALFVQILHYFGFTTQLIMLGVFHVKVKNLAFDTSKMITNAWFSTKN